VRPSRRPLRGLLKRVTRNELKKVKQLQFRRSRESGNPGATTLSFEPLLTRNPLKIVQLLWTAALARAPGVKGFQLLPRRWMVERSFASLGRSRRLAKDFEATIESSTA
jgi:hypothetical protein